MLQVALVVPRTEAEGPGVRIAIWVLGCPFRCKGCCNPEMLDASSPPPGTRQLRASELVAAAIAAGVEGVSFLGGEPTSQSDGLAVVAERVRAAGLTVMIFSGYTLAELRARARSEPGVERLLASTDLLVDGRYVESLRTTTRRWIGSTNQALHFLSDRYSAADARFGAHNTMELRLVRTADGSVSLVVNGWPAKGALKVIDA